VLHVHAVDHMRSVPIVYGRQCLRLLLNALCVDLQNRLMCCRCLKYKTCTKLHPSLDHTD
jgi:hypothetical protein